MNGSIAWTCASNTTLQLSVLPVPAGDDNATMITITSPPNIDTIYFGEQIPNIPPIELLELRRATSENGSAYYFRATYDRVVLLREDGFTQAKTRQAQSVTQHTGFLPGDSLWRCTFKERLIKGYLYVDNPMNTNISTAASGTANATTTNRLPQIPYSVKLVEERIPNGKIPYCEKMLVERDDSLSSQSQTINLSLSDPDAEAAAYTQPRTRRKHCRRQQQEEQEDSANHCQCQWLIQ